MAEEPVDILVRLRNLQQFVAAARTAARALHDIGTSGVSASDVVIGAARRVPGVIGLIGKAASESAVFIARAGGAFVNVFSRIREGASRTASAVRTRMAEMRGALMRPIGGGALGGVGGALAGAAAAYISMKGIRDAIEFTSRLGVQSQATAKIMGMSTQTMAEYFALATAHSVNIRTLSMAFRGMATVLNGANTGSKTSIGILKSLGISMSDVHSRGGNMNSTMQLILDHLAKMPGGVTKTYVATRLLGRGWQALMPMIGQGTKELQHQLQAARDLGVVMGGDPVRAAVRLHDAQVMLKLASEGLQVQFATRLVPAALWVIQHLLRIYVAIRVRLGPVFAWLGGIVRQVSNWFNHHKDVLASVKNVLMAMVPVILAVKAAQILLNIAMAGNPIVRVAFVLIVLAEAFMYAYKHSKSFRDTVKTVWADVQRYSAAAWRFLQPIFAWIGKIIHNNVIPALVYMRNHWKNVWNAIVAAAKWAWNNALHPVFNGLVWFIRNVVIPVARFLGKVFQVAWIVISTAARIAWPMLRLVFSAIRTMIGSVIIPLVKVLASVFRLSWDIISHIVSNAWNNILHPLWNAINTILSKVIIPVVRWLAREFQKAFTIITNVVSWTWNNVLKPVFAFIKSAISDVQWLIDNIGKVGKGIGGFLSSLNPFGSAAGRVTMNPQYSIIGEYGPELLRLPRSSRVIPMNKHSASQGSADITSLNRGGFKPQWEAVVVIDRREIARAVGKVVDDRGARR